MIIYDYGISSIWYQPVDIPVENTYQSTTGATVPQRFSEEVECFNLTTEQFLPEFHLSKMPQINGSVGAIEYTYTIAFKNYSIASDNKAYMVRLFEVLSKAIKDIDSLNGLDFKEENLELFI